MTRRAATVTGECCTGAELETDALTSAPAADVVRDSCETLQLDKTKVRPNATSNNQNLERATMVRLCRGTTTRAG